MAAATRRPVSEQGEYDDEGTLVIEQYFAIVPEWVIDAEISDAAYRLYSVLLRYGQSSGTRMPSRALLARRLKKRSTDSVDRALKELVGIGAVVIERRRRGKEFLSNRYHLRSHPPTVAGANGPAVEGSGGSRKSAATSDREEGSRKSAATPGRKDAARVAAPVRHYPVVPTQEKPPPPSPSEPDGAQANPDRVEEFPGGHDLDRVVAECQALRRRLGLPVTRWTAKVIADVLTQAVREAGWPAAAAVPALLAVAADPATRSPGRLSCAGPWWDVAELAAARSGGPGSVEAEELAELEARLAELGGERVRLQRLARAQLAAESLPVARFSVARRAWALHLRPSEQVPAC